MFIFFFKPVLTLRSHPKNLRGMIYQMDRIK